MPTYYDPVTGKPVAQAAKTYYDPTTGAPVQQGAADVPRANPTPVTLPPDFGSDTFKAAVHAQMLGIDPGMAYTNREEIDKQLKSQGAGSYDDGQLDDTIANDIKVGFESSIFGLHHREALPETIKNPGMIDKFVSGLSEMFADLPWYVAGGVVGGAAGSEAPVVGNAVGAAAGAFAIPSAMREALVLGIKDGEVKDFPDLLRRAGKVVWEGTKGAVLGAATELTGGIAPVIAKSPLTSMAIKGLFQATGMTVAADVLEGHLPTAKDFAGNAALIIPLNLITHGLPLLTGDAKQAVMDVYAKDGKTPQETTETLNAQPPVKPDLPEGLRPAIKHAEGVTEGDTTDTHDKLAERVLSYKPVSMEKLEAEPALADDVLQNPTVHDQDVIDRAWQIKSEAINAGETKDLPEGATSVTRDEAVEARESANKTGRHAENMQGVRSLASEMPEGEYVRTEIPIEKIVAAKDADPELVKQYAEREGKFPPSYGTMQKGKVLLEDGNHRLEAARARGDKSLEVIMPRAAFDAYSGEEKPLRIEDEYDRGSMKTGRGFVTPDGKFLSRSEARAWMKDNEPDTHEIWLQEQNGDKQAELHTEDYASARNRVQARSLVQGDPVASDIPPHLKRFLAEARST